MGRGYSATRSSSARPTKNMKIKRARSMSSLRDEISSRAASKSAAPSARSNSKGSEAHPPTSTLTIKRLLDTREDEEAADASEDDDETVIRQTVLTKYKAGGVIVDETLDMLTEMCVPGANTFALCRKGDAEIKTRAYKTFTKQKNEEGKTLPRGSSYPCNVSVNNVLCNHAPFSECDGVVLAAGDIVKIHLGVHIDGYPCSAARTIVVPTAAAGGAAPAVPQAVCDALEAAKTAMLGMMHLLIPGADNGDITDFVHHVGAHFGVEAVEGCLSTRTKRWLIDGMQAIIARRVVREDPQQDVEAIKIKPFQVWTLDVAFTTSPSYKMQPAEPQPNIFRKNELTPDRDPRLQSAVDFLNEIKYKFHCFPFHPLLAEHPLKAKMGISTLRKAGLLDDFIAMQTKGKYITTRFSATVCVTKTRVNVLCGLPKDFTYTDVAPRAVPADVAELLARPLTFGGAAAEGGVKKLPKKKSRKEEGEVKAAQ